MFTFSLATGSANVDTITNVNIKTGIQNKTVEAASGWKKIKTKTGNTAGKNLATKMTAEAILGIVGWGIAVQLSFLWLSFFLLYYQFLFLFFSIQTLLRQFYFGSLF